MNKNNSIGNFIPFVFGIMGLTLVVLVLTTPTEIQDRILAAAVGSAGIFVAIIKLPMRKRNSNAATKPVSTDEEAQELDR